MSVASPANAGVLSYSGTEGGVNVGTAPLYTVSGSSFGALSLPANLVFTDNLGSNSTAAPVVTTDTWTFSVPTLASLGTTVTGEQIDLSNFSITGTLDSVALYSGTPGSGTKLVWVTSGALPTFTGGLIDTVGTGNYYLQVQATLGAASNTSTPTTGSYTGVLVAAAVPEPQSWTLLLAGLCGIGAARARRRR